MLERQTVLDAAAQALVAPGGRFEIETALIRGVPTRVWKHAEADLGQVLRASRERGDTEFVVFGHERVSYAEHGARVAAFAHALAELGVRPGDRVAVAVRNLPDFFIGFWGAIAAGAVVVPLNGWWSADELAFGLADSGASVVVADDERLARIASAPGGFGRSAVVRVRSDAPVGMALDDIVAGSDPGLDLPEIEAAPDDPVSIFYTSGTTGRPKGAVGTHRNMCTALMNIEYIAARNALREPWVAALTGQAAFLLAVPLFHVTGCHGAMGALHTGGRIVLMAKWDPHEALALVERERITSFTGVPAMMMQLIDALDGKADVSSLRRIVSGGAAVPDGLARRMADRFPSALCGNAWGMTETSQVVAGAYGRDYVANSASCGFPVPVDELRVIDDVGAELTPGTPGELEVRGPNVVVGYWNRPDATQAAFRDGWFRTGDLATLDTDGRLTIVDRIKDVVIRGGENVGSVEVESVLFEHPAVLDAAVVGIPHAVLGEEVAAVVQVRAGATVSEQDLRDHVAARLARFKVPVRVSLTHDPLPRNAAGKLLKPTIRASLVDAVNDDDRRVGS